MRTDGGMTYNFFGVHPLVKGDAQAIAGIAPKMLVGEEKNFFAFLEGPL